MFLGTFSKIFCPGLRLGWVAAEHSVLEEFVKIKQSADLHTSNFDQALPTLTLKTTTLTNTLKKLKRCTKNAATLS